MAGTAARQFERRFTKTRRRLFRRGPIVSAETVRSDFNGRRVMVKTSPGFGDASEAGVFVCRFYTDLTRRRFYI